MNESGTKGTLIILQKFRKKQQKNTPLKPQIRIEKMSQSLGIKKQEQSSSEISVFQASITEFSSVMVELFCVEINRQLTLQLTHDNCMEDMTTFLKDQKIIDKNTDVSYYLPNSPTSINSLWTLKQIMDTFDLKLQDKLIFTVQVDQENHDYGKFQKKKEVCCRSKCQIF